MQICRFKIDRFNQLERAGAAALGNSAPVEWRAQLGESTRQCDPNKEN